MRQDSDSNSPPAHGPGPFITRWVRERADGLCNVSTSRRHRKGLRALRALAADAHRHGVRTSGGWSRLWAPGRVSWWIAVLFMIGSALFAAGGYASSVPVDSRPFLRGAAGLNLAFFVGSLFFTSAAYLQFLEAANGDPADTFAGQPQRWRWWAWKPRSLGFLAALIQFVGTLLFNVNCADAMISGLTWEEEDVLVWTPNMLGCVCFLTASYLAFVEVSHTWFSVRPRDLAWWIAVINLMGSVAFQVSALYSFAGPGAADAEALRLASVYTFLGAVGFFAGAYLLLPEMFDERETA